MSSLTLYFFLTLLFIDGIIELSFISNMVGWLHRRGGKTFDFSYTNNTTSTISGKPEHLVVDQGHTSNGAAGTIVVVIGIGGFLLFALRRSRPSAFRSSLGASLYYVWLVFTVLSAILTLAALIYTFTLTNKYGSSSISAGSAAQRYVDGVVVPYPLGAWTPEIWCNALLRDLQLVHQSDIDDVSLQLALMRGWRWNLIPMMILGFIVAGLAWVDAFKWKREGVDRSNARYHAAPKA